MAYASITHVQNLNAARGIFDGNSKPNATQVYEFIDQAAGMIDGALTQAGYSVPIVAAPTAAALILENANAIGGAYFAECSSQTTTKREQFQQMWEAALKMLANTELPGVSKDESQARIRQGPIASPPFFTRDMSL